jgi:ribosomal protein S6E (S10)
VGRHKVADNCSILVISTNAKSDIANVEDLAGSEHFKLLLLGYRVVDDKAVRNYGLIKMLILGGTTEVGVTLENELSSAGGGRTILRKAVVYTANHKGAGVNGGCRTLRPVCVTVNDLLLEGSENRACKIEDELIVVDLAVKVYLEGE